MVSGARLLDAISHDEMLELAAHGARVLHAESIDFARRSGIALYARATAASGRPGGSEAPGGRSVRTTQSTGGTRIDAADSPERGIRRIDLDLPRTAGVTARTDLVKASCPRRDELLAALDELHIELLATRLTGANGIEALVWHR